VVNSSNTKASASAKLSRSHVIEFSDSGLCSLLGGKWTSFRHMGQECVEDILERSDDIKGKHDSVQTMAFNLIGSYSRQELLTGMIPSHDKLMK
jgi:glycerol-3-phosphate dehydrogenase